jgi:glucokinase
MSDPVVASVDLGGTNIRVAVGTRDGGIQADTKQPTRSHEGPLAVLQRIAEMVNTLAAGIGRKPSALGVGVPGLADLASGVVKFLPNLATEWRNVPARAVLEPAVGCPVYLLNDARAATLGELTFGLGRGVETMIVFTLGTGIGGGVVVDGRLRLGPLGAAGEIGHQTILPDGPPCGCGSRGCLETLASGPAISAEGSRLMQSGNAPTLYEMCGGDVAAVSPATMGRAARAGDTNVARAIERAAEWLGIAAANLVATLHPDLIVLAGGVAELDDLLIVPMRETIRRRVRIFPTDDLRVARSSLGDAAGLLGGLALAATRGLLPVPAPRRSH